MARIVLMMSVMQHEGDEANMKQRQHGFTLVEIMIVVAIVGLLATLAMPSFMRARETNNNSMCINNLRVLATAKTILTFEHRLGDGDTVEEEDINLYLKRPFSAMVEPTGGEYDLQPVPLTPLCTAGHVY